ncbi:MAG: DUF3179 domain-containing protein [Chloroflexota bacterium]|nr:DUF3179 domain-containing protein [Chloroflexota bacterium]
MWWSSGIWILLVLLLVACDATGAAEDGAGALAVEAPSPTAEQSEIEQGVEEEPSVTSVPEGTEESEEDVIEEVEEEELLEEKAGPPPRLAARVGSWETDWSKHTVPLDELFSGGPPRDGIPPIDNPRFVSIEEAAEYLTEDEPVVLFEHEGEARAYPLAILMWHEIVNDEVGGQPVTVTFCPLCNTALAFDRELGGRTLDFGTSGLLRNSDLVMWDRQTESLWQQVTGEAIVGELAGERLSFLPASILSFEEFRQAYPDGEVLSRETGHFRDYGTNPYVNYDNLGNRPFLFSGEIDDRLPAMERVVGVTVGDEAVAYPFSTLEEVGAANDEVGGQPLAVLYAPETLSALDSSRIEQSEAVGSAVAYDPVVEGERLTFEKRDGQIVDVETGSLWDITGRAVEGPLEGTQLEIVPHANHFWFAFQAFYPDVRIWTP